MVKRPFCNLGVTECRYLSFGFLRTTWRKELAYAKAVLENGFFLGIADLALLASARQKKGYIVCFDTDFSANRKFESLDGILHRWISSSETMPCKDEPDFASPDTFCFAAVRADYNECKFSQLNHFVPLFYKGRVGEGLWATIAEGSLQRLEKRLEQLRVDTATEEVQDEYVFSMIEVIAKMEQQINFTRKMFIQPQYLRMGIVLCGHCFP